MLADIDGSVCPHFGPLSRGSLVRLDGAGLSHIERPLHYVCYHRTRRHDPTIKTFLEWVIGQADRAETS